jgi:tetratricopeptide (TPR) repeat protein
MLMDAGAKRIRDGELSSAPEAELSLRLSIGHVFRNIAEYQAAHEMLDPAVKLARSIYPENHPQLARTIGILADLSAVEGKISDALSQFETWQAILKQVHEGDHEDVAWSYLMIANCLRGLGRDGEALTKAQAGLAMSQRLSMGDSMPGLRGQFEVAAALYGLDRPVEALSMIEALLPKIQVQREGDLLHAWTLAWLGDCLLNLDRAPEALPRYEESKAILQRWYAADHPNVAASLYAVGKCLVFLGQADASVSQFEAAIEMCRRLGDVGNAQRALSLLYLAEALRRTGRLEEAERHAREGVRLSRTHLEWGMDNSRLHGEFVLAHVLCDAGRTEEAAQSLREFISIVRHNVPDAKAIEVSALQMLAWVLLKKRDLTSAAGAEFSMRECLAICENAVVKAQFAEWLRFQTMSLLGEALLAQGRFAPADSLLLAAYDGLKDDLQVPRPGGASGVDIKGEALERIVKLYESWDTAEPDMGYAEKAAEWRLKLEGLAASPP